MTTLVLFIYLFSSTTTHTCQPNKQLITKTQSNLMNNVFYYFPIDKFHKIHLRGEEKKQNDKFNYLTGQVQIENHVTCLGILLVLGTSKLCNLPSKKLKMAKCQKFATLFLSKYLRIYYRKFVH